jgi:hypothetical protein
MNRHLPFVCLLTVGTLGCFGADKEMNSQCLPAPCPWDVGGGAGTAGTSGTGGTGGGGNPNGAIVGSPLATFDSGLDGFMFGTYDEPANLNGASSTMKGTLSFDGAVGNPNPGSLKVVAPYSGANQYVDVQKSYGTGNPQDWTGKTLHVRIRATEGTFKGGAQVYAITTGSFVFGGKFANFMPNSNWQEFTVDVSNPTNGAGASQGSGYDPSKVVVFGVQLNTGSSGAGATPVTFNIDSFSIDPPIAGATGAAGTGGGAGAGGGAGTSGTGGSGGSGDASVGN